MCQVWWGVEHTCRCRVLPHKMLVRHAGEIRDSVRWSLADGFGRAIHINVPCRPPNRTPQGHSITWAKGSTSQKSRKHWVMFQTEGVYRDTPNYTQHAAWALQPRNKGHSKSEATSIYLRSVRTAIGTHGFTPKPKWCFDLVAKAIGIYEKGKGTITSQKEGIAIGADTRTRWW